MTWHANKNCLYKIIKILLKDKDTTSSELFLFHHWGKEVKELNLFCVNPHPPYQNVGSMRIGSLFCSLLLSSTQNSA